MKKTVNKLKKYILYYECMNGYNFIESNEIKIKAKNKDEAIEILKKEIDKEQIIEDSIKIIDTNDIKKGK